MNRSITLFTLLLVVQIAMAQSVASKVGFVAGKAVVGYQNSQRQIQNEASRLSSQLNSVTKSLKTSPTPINPELIKQVREWSNVSPNPKVLTNPLIDKFSKAPYLGPTQISISSGKQ